MVARLLIVPVAVAIFAVVSFIKPPMKVHVGESYDPDARVAYFEGKRVDIPRFDFTSTSPYVLGSSDGERFIDVDLSEQKLRAYEGGNLFLETLVSSGLPWTPTPTGEFWIWAKAKATKMEGGSGKYYYYLPNVPYVMFFENSKVAGYKGYSLHGTYWHNDFGKPHSHGCVNLPTEIAQKLYYWTSPDTEGKRGFVRTESGVLGTKIVIHD